MTRREQILARITANLAGTAGVGTRIYRSRIEPFARAEAPALVLEFVNETATENQVPFLDWTMMVRVMVIARGNVPDQLADPTVQDIHSRLSADISLGGLAYDIIPASTSFDLVESDQPTGVISMMYRVRYRTKLTDLTTA